MMKHQSQKPKSREQLLLFPAIKQVQKQALPDIQPIPAQLHVAFCQQCGQLNPGLSCPRCGARRCASCGDHARRVQMGFFVAKCPYGYRNVRIDGRALVEVHSENGPKVKRIFQLYAHHGHTLDSLMEALAREGVAYSASMPRFCRSKIYDILRDRAYIGEVEYHGQWHVGKHPALIDAMTWRRVQTLLGESAYKSHEMTYAGELIKCACCGRPIPRASGPTCCPCGWTWRTCCGKPRATRAKASRWRR